MAKPSPTPGPARSIGRRIARWLLRIVLGLVVLVLALLLGAWIAIQFRATRAWLRGPIEGLVSGLIPGELRIGAIEELRLRRVVLRDVRILDPEGKVVIRVAHLVARPQVAALTRELVRIDSVRARGVEVELRLSEGGTLGLVDAFTEPSETSAPEEPSSWVIDVRRIAIAEGRVRLAIGPEPYVELRSVALRGSVRSAASTRIVVDRLDFEGTRGERLLLGTRGLRGAYRTGTNEASSIDAALRGGEDRLALDARLRNPAEEDADVAASQVDARLSIPSLTPRMLAVFGLEEEASNAPRRIRGDVEVRGRLDDAAIDGSLWVDERRIRLGGRYAPGTTSRAEVCFDAIPLAALWSTLPADEVDGCVAIEAGDFTAEDFPLAIELRGSAFAGDDLPDARLAATVRTKERRIELLSLVLPGLGRSTPPPLALEGFVGFDGAMELHLMLHRASLERDPAIARLLGRARGTLDGRIDLRLGVGEDAPSPLAASVQLAATRLRAAGVRAAELALRADVGGTLEAPRGRLRASGRALEASALRMESVALEAEGGLAGLRAHLGASLGRDRSLELEAHVAGTTERVHGDLRGWFGERRSPWRLEVARASYAPTSGAARVEGLALTHGDARITGRLALAGGARVDAAIDVEALSLDALLQALAVPRGSVAGTLAGTIRVQGTTRIPLAQAQLSFRDGNVLGVRGVRADLDLDYGRTAASATVAIETEDAGEARVEAAATWSRPMPPARALAEAQLDVTGALDEVSLAAIDRAQAQPVGIAGKVGATLDVRGTLAAPEVELRVEADEVEAAQLPAIDDLELHGDLRWGDEGLALTLASEDDEGELVGLTARAELSSRALAEGSIALAAIAWQARATLAERTLSTLPIDASALGDVPLFVSAMLDVENQPGRPLGARAQARVHGRPGQAEQDEDACVGLDALDVSLRAELARGRTEADLALGWQERPVGRVHVAALTPVDAWLSGDASAPPISVDASGTLDRIDASALPYLCRYARGELAATIEASELLRPDAHAKVTIDAPALRFAEQRPLHVQGEVELGADAVRASMALSGADGSRGNLRARIPFSWGEDGATPSVPDGPLAIEGRFQDLSLEPFTPFTPFVPRRAGTLDGNVSIEGTSAHPAPRGELTLRDSTLVMPGLEQRLSDVSARVSLSPDRVVLHELRARDVRGTVALAGELAFVGATPTRLAFDVRSHDFPVRQSGVAIASVTSRASLHLVRETSALRGELVLDELAVRMPDESGGSVQDLEENADVVYLDTPPPGWEPNESRQEPAPAADDLEPGAERASATEVEDDSPFVPTYLHVSIRRPFWIRRTDFAVQLTADLRVAVEEEGVELTGEVQTVRGFLELLGTSFEIREGSVRFPGGYEIDPTLDVNAVANADRSNEVRVQVRGTLTDLKLTFFDANDRELTAGLAVQCITTGSCDELGELGNGGDAETATQQARSALASMTVGLLTTAARHGIGDAVPRIAISSGDRLEELTVRAGFDANRLIPPFLRGIVLSLYVEGFVSTESQSEDAARAASQSRNTQAAGGVLIELRHPHRVVTRGRYEPPTTWSMDVTWQP